MSVAAAGEQARGDSGSWVKTRSEAMWCGAHLLGDFLGGVVPSPCTDDEEEARKNDEEELRAGGEFDRSAEGLRAC